MQYFIISKSSLCHYQTEVKYTFLLSISLFSSILSNIFKIIQRLPVLCTFNNWTTETRIALTLFISEWNCSKPHAGVLNLLGKVYDSINKINIANFDPGFWTLHRPLEGKAESHGRIIRGLENTGLIDRYWWKIIIKIYF